MPKATKASRVMQIAAIAIALGPLAAPAQDAPAMRRALEEIEAALAPAPPPT